MRSLSGLVNFLLLEIAQVLLVIVYLSWCYSLVAHQREKTEERHEVDTNEQDRIKQGLSAASNWAGAIMTDQDKVE